MKATINYGKEELTVYYEYEYNEFGAEVEITQIYYDTISIFDLLLEILSNKDWVEFDNKVLEYHKNR